MPKKRSPRTPTPDSQGRNVPNRLNHINERVTDLEKNLAATVEEVAADVVPGIVRAEIRRAFSSICDDLGSNPVAKP